VVDVLLLLGLKYCSRSFLFLVSFSFLAGSIRTVIWYCVVGEAKCNWYLLILINSLYQKKNIYIEFSSLARALLHLLRLMHSRIYRYDESWIDQHGVSSGKVYVGHVYDVCGSSTGNNMLVNL
jgi:hypothetical protein